MGIIGDILFWGTLGLCCAAPFLFVGFLCSLGGIGWIMGGFVLGKVMHSIFTA